jgi:hypothetical protein
MKARRETHHRGSEHHVVDTAHEAISTVVRSLGMFVRLTAISESKVFRSISLSP